MRTQLFDMLTTLFSPKVGIYYEDEPWTANWLDRTSGEEQGEEEEEEEKDEEMDQHARFLESTRQQERFLHYLQIF